MIEVSVDQKGIQAGERMSKDDPPLTDNHPVEDVKAQQMDHLRLPGSPGKNPFTSSCSHHRYHIILP